MKLLLSACSRLLCGLILLGMLLFGPAGTFRWPGAWCFLGVLFIPMLAAGIVLFIKNPSLLQKRLQTKEKELSQKAIILLSLLMFIAGFVLAGFDFRFGWSALPQWCSTAAAIFFLLGYGLYAEVLRENSYLSRTIEVQSGQKVIDTGLYARVRHPMYAATLLMFLSIPLILGSVWAFMVFLAYPPLIISRIKNEEKVLKSDLEGYADYVQKVKYRLIPHIW